MVVKKMQLMLIQERMWSDEMKSAILHNSLKKFCYEGEKNLEATAKEAY